jgi:hypothetical protein
MATMKAEGSPGARTKQGATIAAAKPEYGSESTTSPQGSTALSPSQQTCFGGFVKKKGLRTATKPNR